jgi:hypothetical protein
MKHSALIATTFAGILSSGMAADLFAQTRADFSGTWTTAPDPAATPAAPAGAAAPGGGAGRAAGARGAAPGGAGGGGGARGGGDAGLGSGWGPDLTMVQAADRLTVTYAFFGRGDMQAPLKFVYSFEPVESTNTVMMGRGIQELRSRTQWEAGTKLIITTQQTIPDPAGGKTPLTSEMRQTLSLDSPTSMVVETVRNGVMGGPPSTTRTVYRKTATPPQRGRGGT